MLFFVNFVSFLFLFWGVFLLSRVLRMFLMISHTSMFISVNLNELAMKATESILLLRFQPER